jgi:hypothetical protein
LGLRLVSLQNVSRLIVGIEIFLISRPFMKGVPGDPVVSEFMGLSPVSTRKNSSSESTSETALGMIVHCGNLLLVRCHSRIDRFAGDGSKENTFPSLPTRGSVHIETQPWCAPTSKNTCPGFSCFVSQVRTWDSLLKKVCVVILNRALGWIQTDFPWMFLGKGGSLYKKESAAFLEKLYNFDGTDRLHS